MISGLEAVFILAGILFAIGCVGVLVKTNMLIVVLSLELMFNAVVLAAIGTSRFGLPITTESETAVVTGHILGVVVITITALETGLFFVLLFALYRRFGKATIRAISDLRG